MYKYVIALTQGCSDSFKDFVDFSIRINISIAACFGVDELSINGNLNYCCLYRPWIKSGQRGQSGPVSLRNESYLEFSASFWRWFTNNFKIAEFGRKFVRNLSLKFFWVPIWFNFWQKFFACLTLMASNFGSYPHPPQYSTWMLTFPILNISLLSSKFTQNKPVQGQPKSPYLPKHFVKHTQMTLTWNYYDVTVT